MAYQIDVAAELKRARTLANFTQLGLSVAIRERFRGYRGRLPARVTIWRIETGREKNPLPLTWARFRAVLPNLPDLG